MGDDPSGQSTGLASLAIADGGCWNQIGIAGDQTCPDLQTHIHCRNCPVFALAARAFFERPADPHYLAEWTQWLGRSAETASQRSSSAAELTGPDQISLLIFRLGKEWMALPTQTVSEVTLPRPLHRIPHRSSTVLVGLVNLRGQLQLCISLHGLLGLDTAPLPPPGVTSEFQTPKDTDLTAATAGSMATQGRLIVLRNRERSESWVFAADEILGVQRIPRSQMHSVSSALANPEVSFSQAILAWEDHSVTMLDEQRIFAALRSIGQ